MFDVLSPQAPKSMDCKIESGEECYACETRRCYCPRIVECVLATVGGSVERAAWPNKTKPDTAFTQ